MDNNDIHMLLPVVENDNQLDLLREYLNEGINPNCKTTYYDITLCHNTMPGTAIIHLAVYSSQSNPEAIRELIKAGADINLPNSAGYTPLHLAVIRRKHDVLKILLDSGAHQSINAKTYYGRTALHLAICNGDVSSQPDVLIVETLLQYKDINLNIIANKLSSPLWLAVKSNSLEIVELLLSKGANPNVGRDFNDNSCLHAAIEQPFPEYYIVSQLICKGANIYYANAYHYSPMDILLMKTTTDQGFRFALRCLKVVVLKCEIYRELMIKIQTNHQLFYVVHKCYKEVETMKKDIIYGNLTLYNFLTSSFVEEHFVNPILQIYKPVVEKLVNGSYFQYFFDIFDFVEDRNLYEIAEKIICSGISIKDVKKENYPKLIAKVDLGIFKFLSRLDIFFLIVAFSNVRVSDNLLQL